jgi:hypothetical protein
MRMHWNKRIIADLIKRLYKNGEQINSYYVQCNQRPLYAAAIKYFGSWGKAIESSGLSYKKVRIKKEFRIWSKRLIAESILSRAQKGLPLNCLAVYNQDRSLYQAAKRYLGRHSWQKALRLAGFNPDDVRKGAFWTKERIIKTIRERWERKLPLNPAQLQKKENGCCGLFSRGVQVFGSWKKAIESAGLNYDEVVLIKIHWWSEKKVISEIKLLSDNKTRLNAKNIHHTRGDLYAMGIKFFGSWSNALAASGIDYNKHYQVWSSKAWLGNLSHSDVKKLERKTLEHAQKRRMIK